MVKKESVYIACFLAALAGGCAKDSSSSSLENKVNGEQAVSVSSATIKTPAILEKTEKKGQTAVKKAPYQKKKQTPEIEKEKNLAPAYIKKIEEKKPIENYEVKNSTYSAIEAEKQDAKTEEALEVPGFLLEKEPEKKPEGYFLTYTKREVQKQHSNKLVKELEGYDMVEQKDGMIILHHPYFIDKTNLPAFKIEKGIVKSVNWEHVYSDMTLEEFKGYIESVKREQSRMKKALERLKEEWRGW